MSNEQPRKPELRGIVLLLRQSLPILERRYHVRRLGIFGSYVRGEQKSSSDLDILVEFLQPPSLIQFVTLERELGELLGVRVDLVMKSALKPVIGRHILQELIPV